MSGRAGRRGFDPIGNVVFFGIPYRKVQRLITANIPWLIGNFPINVSLVLRLLLMTSKGDDEEDALTKVSVILTKRCDIKYLQVQSFHLFNPFRIAMFWQERLTPQLLLVFFSWPFIIICSLIPLKKNALYVSANVFSKKVLTGDTIFYVIRNPFTVHCPVHLFI